MSNQIRLSISNIAWDKPDDDKMYAFLCEEGIEGLEIAPTRIFPENPYEKLQEARQFQQELYEKYGLRISSMQSIWYGRTERIFGTESERKILVEYTKKAFAFAKELECGNLVFGCPKNRNLEQGENAGAARDFFYTLGELASAYETVLAVEANPVIYGTNYLNKTDEACDFVKTVGSRGVKLNYDFGTVLYNRESISYVSEICNWINHVHISEPGLAEVAFTECHEELVSCLKEKKYSGYVSVEMKRADDLGKVQGIVRQLKQVVRGTE